MDTLAIANISFEPWAAQQQLRQKDAGVVAASVAVAVVDAAAGGGKFAADRNVAAVRKMFPKEQQQRMQREGA